MSPEPGWKRSLNVDDAFGSAPLDQALSLARAAGCDQIEFSVGSQARLALDAPQPACNALAEQVRSAGLSVSALLLDGPSAGALACAQNEVRQRAIEKTAAALDRAAWLGTNVVILPTVAPVAARAAASGPDSPAGSPSASPSYDDTYALALDAMLSLRFEAERCAVHLAYKNDPTHFGLSPIETRDFLDRVNSPWVRLYFDLDAALPHGDPVHWIAGLGHRIIRVALGQLSLGATGSGQAPAPASGMHVDWPQIRSALRTIGHHGPLTYHGPIEEVGKFKRAFDRVVGA